MTHDQEAAEIESQEARNRRQPHPVPAKILSEDWTGTKYAKYWKTYGKGPELLQLEDASSDIDSIVSLA